MSDRLMKPVVAIGIVKAISERRFDLQCRLAEDDFSQSRQVRLPG